MANCVLNIRRTRIFNWCKYLSLKIFHVFNFRRLGSSTKNFCSELVLNYVKPFLLYDEFFAWNCTRLRYCMLLYWLSWCTSACTHAQHEHMIDLCTVTFFFCTVGDMFVPDLWPCQADGQRGANHGPVLSGDQDRLRREGGKRSGNRRYLFDFACMCM